MWSIECFPDPVKGTSSSSIVLGRIPIATLFSTHWAAFQEGERDARVALADYVSRKITPSSEKAGRFQVMVEQLDRHSAFRSRNGGNNTTPYMLERSDVWCTETDLNVLVRATVSQVLWNDDTMMVEDSVIDEKKSETAGALDTVVCEAVMNFLTKCVSQSDFVTSVLQHVACSVVQSRIRAQLASGKAIAFIAEGSILPRKSGASSLPMASPPAIPFQAPTDSPTKQQVTVEMGSLCSFLPSKVGSTSATAVTFTGLVVPAGITLIVGGGYHGKSTLLRCIAAGVYNKIPGDGREFCVTVRDAVSVRAEDGRYVNHCNVSAFISNLPTLPGQSVDTRQFSTREASGSTSQAANVSEAIEMGATALLVDEDVSAANFMARDGRMRALVMDESITPLLYRVNGLYQTHGISSVVVVGGVGDWLDVPSTVILLNRYVASDATAKAASVSYQFSYGHVQYAGRGVVHRLQWDKEGTPISRRMTSEFTKSCGDKNSVTLMEGGHVISIHEESVNGDSAILDEDMGCIDLSRCEQLLGKKNQLYACGLCVAWVLRMAKTNPRLGICDLVTKLEEEMDKAGGLLPLLVTDNSTALSTSSAWTQLVETVGFAYRPRRHEIFMAVTRMRGIVLEEVPIIDDGSDASAETEAERKKRELEEMWSSRRRKNRFS